MSFTAPSAPATRVPHALRVDGGVRVRVGAGDGRSFLAELAQRGGLRVKTPNRRDGAVELVLVNTAGGVAGGDRHAVALSVAPGGDAVLSTVAAEKLYRSDGATARITVDLDIAPGGRLAWLPQETIFHDGARLDRRLDVRIGDAAEVTIAEMLVFGRRASGEQPGHIDLVDRWSVRREGRLVFAEALRLAPDFSALLRDTAVFAGANAIATIVQSGPGAESRLAAVRAVLPPGAAGATAWNGSLVVRCVAEGAEMLRRTVAPVLAILTGRPLPRVWGT